MREEEKSVVSWKRQRLEHTPTQATELQELRRAKRSEHKCVKNGKRRRSIPPEKETKRDSCHRNEEKHKTKRCRVKDDASVSSPPPVLPASPLANLSDRTIQSFEHTKQRVVIIEEKHETTRFPAVSISIPSQWRQDEVLTKENPENVAMCTNRDDCIGSSQGSDTDDLIATSANVDKDLRTDSHDIQGSIDVERVPQGMPLRTVQVTPPPSTRMLDRKNPPPPPKRPKRRRNYGIVFARAYPRLALSPLVDHSPPSSPRVFRSLENEFAVAMQETPEIRPRVRPAPRMARGTRRSTRAISSGARRSLETPTSTMVLRSRQLNPSLSASTGKPENQREREQRDAQRRQE